MFSIKGSNRTLSDPNFRKILMAAPDYVSQLISTEWLRLEVEDSGPAIAWTGYEASKNRFVVFFDKKAATLSKRALAALWRHEIGHIALGHFQKELCVCSRPLGGVSVPPVMRVPPERPRCENSLCSHCGGIISAVGGLSATLPCLTCDKESCSSCAAKPCVLRDIVCFIKCPREDCDAMASVWANDWRARPDYRVECNADHWGVLEPRSSLLPPESRKA